LELVKSALLAALEALSPGSLFGILTFSSKIGLYDVQGPIPIVKNVFIPPDSDGTILVDLKDVMPFHSFLAPVDTCKDSIARALETIKPMSSWEMATTVSQVQDHALHHTRGFGVALDALVNYLSVEYGTTFELARIFVFLSGPPNYGPGQLDAGSNGDHNSVKAWIQIIRYFLNRQVSTRIWLLVLFKQVCVWTFLPLQMSTQILLL